MTQIRKAIESIGCIFLMLLIPLRVYGCYLNLTHGVDKGYGHSFPTGSYVIVGIYLSVIAAVDLFFSDSLISIELLFAPYMILYPLLEWVGISNDRFAVIVVSLFGMINWGICKFFLRSVSSNPKALLKTGMKIRPMVISVGFTVL